MEAAGGLSLPIQSPGRAAAASRGEESEGTSGANSDPGRGNHAAAEPPVATGAAALPAAGLRACGRGRSGLCARVRLRGRELLLRVVCGVGELRSRESGLRSIAKQLRLSRGLRRSSGRIVAGGGGGLRTRDARGGSEGHRGREFGCIIISLIHRY